MPPKLSCSTVPQACHSDHADQPSEATDRDWGQVSEHSGEKQYRGCGSFQSCLATWSHRPGPTYQPCLPSSGPIQGSAKKLVPKSAKEFIAWDSWCSVCCWKKAC